MFVFKTKKKKNQKKNQEKNRKKNRLEKIKDYYKKFIEYIENESNGINYDLFRNYFDLVVLSALAKKLFKTKNKNKINELVELIMVRWSNLKDEKNV